MGIGPVVTPVDGSTSSAGASAASRGLDAVAVEATARDGAAAGSGCSCEGAAVLASVAGSDGEALYAIISTPTRAANATAAEMPGVLVQRFDRNVFTTPATLRPRVGFFLRTAFFFTAIFVLLLQPWRKSKWGAFGGPPPPSP